MFRLLLDTALKTVTYRWQVIKIVETLVHRQIRFIPIKEGIEFDGQQDLRTKVMIAAGSYVVFQHQSGRSPFKVFRLKAERCWAATPRASRVILSILGAFSRFPWSYERFE